RYFASMKETTKQTTIKVYSQACVYHIVLQGRITSTLLNSVADMQVRDTGNGEISLIGCLPDQSALIGLLHHLHELRCGIVSLKAQIQE
ncbi:hypothetical protein, partial [Carboxylicivirga taeanensis]|uniref:hypothetical protein n=1 Tax=Carboxylicivirga taeanensis TaxID=1416875 RepID=UPI003F6DB0C3